MESSMKALNTMQRELDRGFTLIEGLVALAILVVLVSVTLPPIFSAIREREAHTAANAILDLVEFAKVQAAARNHAYEVVPVITSGTFGGLGQQGTNGWVTVHEGTTMACINFPSCPVDTVNPPPGCHIRTIDLSIEHPWVHLVGLSPQNLVTTSLCIKPDGRVLRTDTQMPVQSGHQLYAAGDARIIVQRFEGGDTPVGTQSAVVIPFNGAARVAF